MSHAEGAGGTSGGAKPPAGTKPPAGAGRAGTARAPRLDPLAVRRQLRQEGLRARHSMSQNFLADPDVLQSILDLAEPGPGRRLLEIGPGLGILTGGLLAAGASVVAVELDRRLAERLTREQAEAVASGALRVVQGDVLDQDVGSLVEPPYEVVANVPYHITSPILHRFLGETPRPERLVLMVQREVAERISAAPGAMSYLSVFVQYHATVRVAFAVPREAFEPAPEVESAVVEIVPFGAGGARGAAAGEATAGRAARRPARRPGSRRPRRTISGEWCRRGSGSGARCCATSWPDSCPCRDRSSTPRWRSAA
jgi:ribosomal RNA small subunit methyltransferase A